MDKTSSDMSNSMSMDNTSSMICYIQLIVSWRTERILMSMEVECGCS